jgi:hypothetical protein
MSTTARSSSPEEPPKASSSEEAKNKRKQRLRTKVTNDEFRGSLKREATWLNTASSRCSNIRRVFTQQENLLKELEVIETESCHVIADLSAAHIMTRGARLRLMGELELVEEKRRKAISQLRTAMIWGSSEGDGMK